MPIDKDINWFENICRNNSFSFSGVQSYTLKSYVKLLLEKNQKVNLISKNSEKYVWEEHIFHSISFLFKIKIKSNAEILDLGTGGGLPGIPLKILLPDIKITLLDSTRKKIFALNEIIQELNLSETKAVSFRAEEIGSFSEYKNKYDYVITRGVSTVKKISNWSYPFLTNSQRSDNDSFIPTRSVLILKGGDISKEILQVQKDEKIKSIKVIDLIHLDTGILKNPDKKLVIVNFNK